jgi:hypothetical protein
MNYFSYEYEISYQVLLQTFHKVLFVSRQNMAATQVMRSEIVQQILFNKNYIPYNNSKAIMPLNCI